MLYTTVKNDDSLSIDLPSDLDLHHIGTKLHSPDFSHLKLMITLIVCGKEFTKFELHIEKCNTEVGLEVLIISRILHVSSNSSFIP